MEQIKRVVILDDDLSEPTIHLANEKVYQFLNDENSMQFDETVKYLGRQQLVNDIDDMQEITSYIGSPNFVSEVLLNTNYQKLFDGVFKDYLVDFASFLEFRRKVFLPFFSVFETVGFKFEKRHQRPVSPEELKDYDVIIMDIMMNDEFDDFTKLAKYLGDVCRSGDYPSIFLISSRDELDSEKHNFRLEAKISSIGFKIIKKSDLLQENAESIIKLIYEQMAKAKNSNKSLSEFTKQLEFAVGESTTNVLKSLWNIDYSYIQQMYACLENENVPFAEHFLNFISGNILFNLEKNSDLHAAISGVESVIDADSERFCSYSKDSDVEIHNVEAALHFLGTRPEQITCSTLDISIEQMGRSIVKIIPFGLLLVKNEISIGARALIHCTQQCDLSRNIIKNGINLIFVEGRILDFPNSEFCIPLPTVVSSSYSRLWLEIDSKKVLAWPYSGMLNYIVGNNFRSISILRPDVVRQVRSNLFQQMSRREESVKTGHNTSFYIKLAVYNNNTDPLIFDYKSEEELQKVLFYQFPEVNSRDKTYHFLDHSHIDVIQWLYSVSCSLLDDISIADLENTLKNNLPKLGKKKQLGKANFILLKDSAKVFDYCLVEKNKSTKVNIIFY